MRRLPGAFVLTVSILLCPSQSAADGVHFSDAAKHIMEPSQKAVIVWDGKTEQMIISSTVRSDDLSNLAWVVPIRSRTKPVVEAADISVIQDLARYFDPVKAIDRKPGQPVPVAVGVDVIESMEVDVYDITILRATEAQALINWLQSHNYRVPAEATPILEEYVSMGDCYFIANRIDLRNTFAWELDEIERIYSQCERRKGDLCDDINKELEALQLPCLDCAAGLLQYRRATLISLLQSALNRYENPLRLPNIFEAQLTEDLTPMWQ